MKKKRIKYYGVEIEITLFNYDNDIALSNPVFNLNYKKKGRRFKSKEEAKKFIEFITTQIKIRRKL